MAKITTQYAASGNVVRNYSTRRFPYVPAERLEMQSERIAPLRNRIAQLAPITREILTTLEPEDMHMDDLPPAGGGRLDWKDRPFRLKCPGCAELAKFPQSLLARQVPCRGCGHK